MTIEKVSISPVFGKRITREALPIGHMELLDRTRLRHPKRYISRMYEVLNDDEVEVTMHLSNGINLESDIFIREQINEANFHSVSTVNKKGDPSIFGKLQGVIWRPTK